MLDFAGVARAGLAADGGLYVPARWPQVSVEQMHRWRGLSYAELAAEVLALLAEGSVSETQLRRLSKAAYSHFNHTAIAPLKQLDHDLFLLELFHGPTLAFKDIALQFLGRLLDDLLPAEHLCTVLGATSGDTGSAAIAAFAGCARMRVFMLHPQGRIAPLQRRQMTTVLTNNIHNFAVQGSFDDCQNMVKNAFNNPDLRESQRFIAVNSINWARIAAQVVYYFYAALALGAPGRAVNFAVPTGNFGNVFAAYTAQQMGLPIERLMIGCNRNDIIARFFNSGQMRRAKVHATLSPSMDIQVSSNFERLLFELHQRDPEAIRALMQQFAETGVFEVSDAVLATTRERFAAHRLTDAETCRLIRETYHSSGEIIDPHSAIGLAAAKQHASAAAPTVVLATAHPGKFPHAIEQALGWAPPPPAVLARLEDLPERMMQLPGTDAALREQLLKCEV